MPEFNLKFEIGECGSLIEKTDYSQNYIVYNSKQEIYDEIEYKKLREEVIIELKYQTRLSFEKMQVIHTIIFGGENGS